MNFRDLTKTVKKTQWIFLAAAAALLVLSATLFFAKNFGDRRVFRFQSVDSGRNNVEWRLLPSRKGSEKISLYVDELLLGPKNERCRPVFSPGTKALFCFERDRVLYVNFTGKLLDQSGNASGIMEGIEIFKKNVLFAFPRLKQVEIYIDGKGLLKEF